MTSQRFSRPGVWEPPEPWTLTDLGSVGWILPDHALRSMIRQGELGVEPLERTAIGATSIDLRLNPEVWRLPGTIVADEPMPWQCFNMADTPVVLGPHELARGCTMESILLPDGYDLCVETRGNIARAGLVIRAISTSPGGPVEFDHKGRIPLVIVNRHDSDVRVQLDWKKPMVQVFIARIHSLVLYQRVVGQLRSGLGSQPTVRTGHPRDDDVREVSDEAVLAVRRSLEPARTQRSLILREEAVRTAWDFAMGYMLFMGAVLEKGGYQDGDPGTAARLALETGRKLKGHFKQAQVSPRFPSEQWNQLSDAAHASATKSSSRRVHKPTIRTDAVSGHEGSSL